MMSYLDGLPLGPVALFAAGYLALLVTVLVWFRSRRSGPRCERCGSLWQRTERGGEWHLCVAKPHQEIDHGR